MTTKQAQALVGCAGWTIPRANVDAFASEGSHLQRYAQVFPVVEINSSFYRPHQRTTYARWAESVPAHFRFSVKLPRAITHEQKLLACEDHVARFADEVGGLGDKLGCVLVQLPPKQGFDQAIADDLFRRLRTYFAGMIACEARNASWFTDGATELLRAQGVTRVIADPPAGQSGEHVPTTADIYARLHGAPRVYYSSYDDAYLDELAKDIIVHRQHGRSVWCIFDNTASGAAMSNALRVQSTVAAPSDYLLGSCTKHPACSTQ